MQKNETLKNIVFEKINTACSPYECRLYFVFQTFTQYAAISSEATAEDVANGLEKLAKGIRMRSPPDDAGEMPTKEDLSRPKEDPKKQAGDKKCPLHLLPTVALRETADALATGAEKYGVYNWRSSDGIKASVYCAALLRHTLQFMDGVDQDEESGLSPLAHVMATCCILMDAKSKGKLLDDRPK